MGFNATKLKVQLKLAVQRLKMLQQKKTQQNALQRKEVAQLLEKGKIESARIRVEHVIREDYNNEALEMLEIYCEMLLARFGLIETLKYGFFGGWMPLIGMAHRASSSPQNG